MRAVKRRMRGWTMICPLRRPSFDKRGVAPLAERNPEAEASVKGATRPSSYREHPPANGEGSSAFRQENQAFPWKWLIQRIVEPLPVERAPARSRRRLALDARGRGLRIIPVPGRPCYGRGLAAVAACPPDPPHLLTGGSQTPASV